MASKKKSNKKVKQVASRAKSAPRTDSNVPVIPGSGSLNTACPVVSEEEKIAARADYTAGGPRYSDDTKIEFEEIAPELARKNALERSKKVELKAEIKSIVNTFSKRIDEQLQELSERVERQLKPLVDVVATIAVAKKDLAAQLAHFEDSLSVALNLNDELEPIEIESMFDPDTTMDKEMANYGDHGVITNSDEGVEMLAEATEDANHRNRVVN